MLFLHGLADSGDSTSRWLTQSGAGGFIRSMEDAGVRVLFPTAPSIPYALQGGLSMAAWYDRTGLPPTAAEHRPSVEASLARLEQQLRELEQAGVPPSRVAVGGFSQGGGIAIQLAYRKPGTALAGAFALSSYACDDSPLWAALEDVAGQDRRRPPLFQRHGAADGYIRPECAPHPHRPPHCSSLESPRPMPALGHAGGARPPHGGLAGRAWTWTLGWSRGWGTAWARPSWPSSRRGSTARWALGAGVRKS